LPGRRSGRPKPRWLRVPLAGVGQSFLRRSPGVAPKATAQSLFAGWVRVFSPPKARGCPSADGSESLFAAWLRVPPLASDPGLYPSPGGSGCPRAKGPRSSLAGWLGLSSCQRPAVIPCRVAPGFPPSPGGSGLPPCRWLGLSSCRRLAVIPCRWLRTSRASGPECPLPGGAESAPCHGSGLPPYR